MAMIITLQQQRFYFYEQETFYDYTVEVKYRFKPLDLIDRVPDKLWTEVHDIVQETGIKTIPKGGEGGMQKSKMAI